MNTQLFDAFSDQSTKLLDPPRELSKLTIEKFEQLVSLQFASLREYTDLNIGQLKAAADIAGPKDVEAYLTKQQDLLKTMGEKMAGDVHAMMALGKEFTEEAQKIAFGGFALMPKPFS